MNDQSHTYFINISIAYSVILTDHTNRKIQGTGCITYKVVAYRPDWFGGLKGFLFEWIEFSGHHEDLQYIKWKRGKTDEYS